MFENLSERLSKTLKNLTGRGRLTEDNVQSTLKEVREALLEADVATEVVTAFVGAIAKKSLGVEIPAGLSPAQFFIKVVNDELTSLMGSKNEDICLNTQPPAVILMAGLQGAGKTTTTAKLAHILKFKRKKTVMLASADIYRPAAIEQLRVLAKQLDVSFFESDSQNPIEIGKAALTAAKNQNVDVLLVDSAGRLHIDDVMMAEIRAIHQILNPIETLFVVDSMTGQDAARSAKVFNEALPLTGVILTKADGDARGGAALSIRYLTAKPIKWIGVGEKIEALEPFYPERMASRILGMGDVLSLIEEIEQKVDKEKAEKFAKKIQKSGGFDLEDYREQLLQMVNMGGMNTMMGMMTKIPGMGGLSKMISPEMQQTQDKVFKRSIAVINSMTPHERCFPALIKGSRLQRIAKGSGQPIQSVRQVLNEHEKMKKVAKQMSGKGMAGMMRSLEARLGGGGFPPGMFPPGA